VAANFGSLKPREVLRALLKAGFYVHETTGSHAQLKHPDKPGRVTVPNHQGFDLPKQIVKSIIRQAGLTNEEFWRLLNE
jgi:predicted RNA binding protein YcfA (HicA-like mRNA interferase family)